MNGTKDDTSSKRVAIVGAGISGIITAAVLKEDGHKATIFEAHSSPGGVWSHAVYPGAHLQNQYWQYCQPDLQWPDSINPDDLASAEQIRSYVDYCLESFGLKEHLKLHTQVLKCDQQLSHRWNVVSRDLVTKATHQEEFDFVVVAQGQYTEDKTNELPWGDRQIFEKAGGKVYTRQTFSEAGFKSLEDKRVAIIGFGKTAVDLCQDVPEKSNPKEVRHIFRAPRWLIPSSVFGIHHCRCLLTRINGEMIPSWDYPRDSLRYFHQILAGPVRVFWTCLQTLFWYGIHYGPRAVFASREVRQRLKTLLPQHHFLMDHRAAAALCPPRYFDKVASGEVMPHCSEVVKFTEKGLLLANGESLKVDVALVCTGNGSTSSKFPYLHQNGQEIDFGSNCDSRGLQLYRHLIHPGIPNLSFAGFNHGVFTCSHVYLGAIWMSCWMRDEISLPSKKEQQACVERIRTWKRQNIGFEPNLNEGVTTRLFYYNDIMMMDFGLNPLRKKNRFLEQFERYGASNYAGVLQEVQQKRLDALSKGEKFRLTPVDRDM
jgi:dimethylaniline monooxygenase (N-oxide forming)